MSPARQLSIQQRMVLTFDLYSLAEKMMRQNLRRRHPGVSEDEIERNLIDWLRRGRSTSATNNFLRHAERPWQSH